MKTNERRRGHAKKSGMENRFLDLPDSSIRPWVWISDEGAMRTDFVHYHITPFGSLFPKQRRTATDVTKENNAKRRKGHGKDESFETRFQKSP